MNKNKTKNAAPEREPAAHEHPDHRRGHAGHESPPAQSGHARHDAHPHDQSHAHAHAHAHDHVKEHDHGAARNGETVITVRAASGLSGDMMLSGLAGLAGLDDETLDKLVEELGIPALHGCLRVRPRSVNHIAGRGCEITLPHEHAHRTFADIAALIAQSAMPQDAKELSVKAFAILAEAEAAVHGKARDDVTFHEVGALDSILDICLVCRIADLLRPAHFVCSPLPLADGAIACAHGIVPSPAPAVLRLLEGIPVCGFRGCGETVTPTALALLKALGAAFGGWPDMAVEKTVISYGSKVFENAPNGALWALGRSR